MLNIIVEKWPVRGYKTLRLGIQFFCSLALGFTHRLS